MTLSAWTEDRVSRLRTLWHEGKTADQIAQDLANGITRSAVLGKVYRMGLSSGRPSAPTKGRSGKPRTVPPSIAPRPPVVPVSQATETGRATLLSVRRSQCRWPLGDPLAADFTVCGDAVARGAYCARHAAVAYRAPRALPQSWKAWRV